VQFVNFFVILGVMANKVRKILIVLSLLATAGFLWSAGQPSKTALSAKSAVKTSKQLSETVSREIVLSDFKDGSLLIEWECPEPEFTRNGETGEVTAVRMQGALPLYEVGVPELPQVSELIDCLPGPVSFQIIDSDIESMNLGGVQPMPEDVAIDPRPEGSDSGPENSKSWQELVAETEKKAGLWPEQMVSLTEGGVFRGHRLVSLKINPVQVDARSGSARILKRIKVRVSIPRDENLQDRALDQTEETKLLRGLLGTMAPTARRDRAVEMSTPREERDLVLDAPPGNRYRMIVNENRVFRVTGEDLMYANAPIGEIDPIDLHVSNKGVEVPIHIVGGLDGHFDDVDYFEFYGERNERTWLRFDSSIYQDPYTQDNVYWLTWGDGKPGVRLGVEDGSWHPTWIGEEVEHVRTFAHFEKDDYLTRLQESSRLLKTQLETRGPLGIYQDHWFWGEIIPALNSQEYVVSLALPYIRTNTNNEPGIGTPVTIRAALQGYSWESTGDNAGNHRAIVSINGVTERGLSVGKISLNDNNVSWTGQSPVVIESDPLDPLNPNITSADLLHGPNLIRVDCPGDGPAGINDRILVNWFEVEYDRAPRAASSYIRFKFDETRGDTFALDLRGFVSRDIQIWKLGQSRLTNMDVRRVTPSGESASWAARFHMIPNDTYDMLAFDANYVRPPFMILPDSTDIDLRAQMGARYVLIAHDSFISDPALLRLDSLRRASFNGSVLTVPLSEVYEQFSHGIETPDAIREFLKYGYEHWTIRPTHACLVGDAVLSSRYNSNPGNLLPGYYAQTFEFGIAASDILFGCVSGPEWDIVPDIAVGRISCRTPEELGAYVDKVWTYEMHSDYEGLFCSRVLMVADSEDQKFDFMSGFSEPAISLMPEDVNIQRLYLDSLRAGQGYARLRSALADGSIVVNYNGHGGGGVWSGTELINAEGVAQLYGQRTFPFVTNFTCYVGAFDDSRSQEVLAEVFLFGRNSITNELVGATGFYSSSGVGWAGAGNLMQRSLYQFMMKSRGLTQGEVVQLNKARFWSSVGGTNTFTSLYSMMMMMNLLGDPGLKLDLPEYKLTPEIVEESSVVETGDTLHVSGTLPWTPTSDKLTFLYMLAYNGNRYDTINYHPAAGQHRIVAPYVAATRFPAFDEEDFFNFTTIESQSFTVPFVIHPRFLTPRGRVVVYATNPFQDSLLIQKQTAIGSFPIYFSDSLESVQVFDVGVWPSNIILSDSTFQVRAAIMHQNDIENVYMRGIFRPWTGEVVLDTMNMTEVEAGLWTSENVGPYHMQGGQYRVKFFVQPSGAELFESELYNLPSQSILDFSVNMTDFEVEPREYPGAHPGYYLPFESTQYANSAPVPMLVFRLTAVSGDTIISLGDTTYVLADSFTVDRVLTDLENAPRVLATVFSTRFRPLPYTITIVIDPDSVVEESNENNNIYKAFIEQPSLYPATRALGTYYLSTAIHPTAIGPHRFWKPGATDTLELYIAPGQLPMDSATLIYYTPHEISDAELIELSHSGLLRSFPQYSWAPNNPSSFRVTLGDSTENMGSSSRVEVDLISSVYDTSGSTIPADIGLFQRHAGSDYWWRLPESTASIEPLDTTYVTTTIIVGGVPQLDTTRREVHYQMTVSGAATDLGEFAVFRYFDEQGPNVEVSVGGLFFTQHSILPSRPEIFANLSDPAGVDRSPGKFFIRIDNDTIPDWQINWSDTLAWGGAASALIRPEIEPGDHQLTVYATDNYGNETTHTVEFSVRGDFGIEWAINYPNPFSTQTTIAYVLTGATDEYVEIKIFTVSGRLIRTIQDTERETANYRTLKWNGEDDRGDKVANGVYFARIKATREGQSVEKTIKLAKVR
jgi:hypothetical protein